MANATARGDQLAAGLADLAEKHGVLANPRGLGLMRAIDVVGDEGPDPALRHALLDAAFHRGLLLLGCGRSAIRFCPALCVTADQIGTALAILDEVVRT